MQKEFIAAVCGVIAAEKHLYGFSSHPSRTFLNEMNLRVTGNPEIQEAFIIFSIKYLQERIYR